VLAVLALVFVVLPIIEITVAIQVAHHIGAFDTILLLVAFSVLGLLLARHEGFSVLGRMRQQVLGGVVPTNALIDGVLVFAGGVLLFVPGFVTGVVGLLLLIPPTRAAVRSVLKRRFRGQVYRLGPGGPAGPGGPGGRGDIIDV
jgi:UPF0716 protein FxsA